MWAEAPCLITDQCLWTGRHQSGDHASRGADLNIITERIPFASCWPSGVICEDMCGGPLAEDPPYIQESWELRLHLNVILPFREGPLVCVLPPHLTRRLVALGYAGVGRGVLGQGQGWYSSMAMPIISVLKCLHTFGLWGTAQAHQAKPPTSPSLS